jgi:hypothetical protein
MGATNEEPRHAPAGSLSARDFGGRFPGGFRGLARQGRAKPLAGSDRAAQGRVGTPAHHGELALVIACGANNRREPTEGASEPWMGYASAPNYFATTAAGAACGHGMRPHRHRGLRAWLDDRWAARCEWVSYFPSTAPLSSLSISEFRPFAALIVAAHQASLPLADMPSMFALMAEKRHLRRVSSLLRLLQL